MHLVDLSKFTSNQKLIIHRKKRTTQLFVKIIDPIGDLLYVNFWHNATAIIAELEIEIDSTKPLTSIIWDHERRIAWGSFTENTFKCTVAQQKLDLTLMQPDHQDFIIESIKYRVSFRDPVEASRIPVNNIFDYKIISVPEDLRIRHLLSTYIVNPCDIRRKLLELNSVNITDYIIVGPDEVLKDILQTIRHDIEITALRLEDLKQRYTTLTESLPSRALNTTRASTGSTRESIGTVLAPTDVTSVDKYLLDQYNRLDELIALRQVFLTERHLIEYICMFRAPADIVSVDDLTIYLSKLDRELLKMQIAIEHLNVNLTELITTEIARMQLMHQHQQLLDKIQSAHEEYLSHKNHLQQLLIQERETIIGWYRTALEGFGKLEISKPMGSTDVLRVNH